MSTLTSVDSAQSTTASPIHAEAGAGHLESPLVTASSSDSAQASSLAAGRTSKSRHANLCRNNWALIFHTHGYTLLEELGKGSYGTVCRSRKDATGEEFAVKALDLQSLRLRSEVDETRLMRKTTVMKHLNHRNLCRLFDVIKTPDYVLFVLELIRGQNLFDTILARKSISEIDARFLFRQIFSAVGHMHAKGFMHRDIKPENILLDGIAHESEGVIAEKTVVKIVDFGLSKAQGNNNSFAGTPLYVAPEVIAVGQQEERRRQGVIDVGTTTYGTPVDCYSAGIVLFVSLAGIPPHFERDTEGLERVYFAPDCKISSKARALVHGLTHPDPTRRFTMQRALEDPWLAEKDEALPLQLSAPATAAEAAAASRTGWSAALRQASLHGPPVASAALTSNGSTDMSRRHPESNLVHHFDCGNLNRLKEEIEACFAPGGQQSSELHPHASSVRQLLTESMRCLMVFTNTADAVVGLASDTKFACDEGEADVVAATLLNAKSWITKFIIEAKALRERSDAMLHDIESISFAVEPGTLLKLLQDHRQFIINLDLTSSFMVQRTEHLEGLISMVRNPKMRPRFVERLQVYLDDWERLLRLLHGPLFVVGFFLTLRGHVSSRAPDASSI